MGLLYQIFGGFENHVITQWTEQFYRSSNKYTKIQILISFFFLLVFIFVMNVYSSLSVRLSLCLCLPTLWHVRIEPLSLARALRGCFFHATRTRYLVRAAYSSTDTQHNLISCTSLCLHCIGVDLGPNWNPMILSMKKLSAFFIIEAHIWMHAYSIHTTTIYNLVLLTMDSYISYSYNYY